jgi:hypothetical protein
VNGLRVRTVPTRIDNHAGTMASGTTRWRVDRNPFAGVRRAGNVAAELRQSLNTDIFQYLHATLGVGAYAKTVWLMLLLFRQSNASGQLLADRDHIYVYIYIRHRSGLRGRGVLPGVAYRLAACTRD